MKTRTKPKDQFAKIHKLITQLKGDRFNVEATISNLARHLEGLSENGKVGILVNYKNNNLRWILDLTDTGCQISQDPEGDADFDVYMSSETAIKVFSGRISPILAMGRESMRVRGNIDFGLRLYRKLAADDSKLDPCRTSK